MKFETCMVGFGGGSRHRLKTLDFLDVQGVAFVLVEQGARESNSSSIPTRWEFLLFSRPETGFYPIGTEASPFVFAVRCAKRQLQRDRWTCRALNDSGNSDLIKEESAPAAETGFSRASSTDAKVRRLVPLA